MSVLQNPGGDRARLLETRASFGSFATSSCCLMALTSSGLGPPQANPVSPTRGAASEGAGSLGSCNNPVLHLRSHRGLFSRFWRRSIASFGIKTCSGCTPPWRWPSSASKSCTASRVTLLKGPCFARSPGLCDDGHFLSFTGSPCLISNIDSRCFLLYGWWALDRNACSELPESSMGLMAPVTVYDKLDGLAREAHIPTPPWPLVDFTAILFLGCKDKLWVLSMDCRDVSVGGPTCVD